MLHLARHADGRCAVPGAARPDLWFRIGCETAGLLQRSFLWKASGHQV